MKRTESGINLIAMIIMIITFFLVIGFAIGAVSTMNLNLAGRSINVITANQLAEAAVAQVMFHVNELTDTLDDIYGFNLGNLSYPSLGLDKYYDGNRNIFENTPPYIYDDWEVEVRFVKLNEWDTFYSTDNSNTSFEVLGATGKVPPYTIDLILTVKTGSFTRHYEVYLTKKWDFVIFAENGPVHIVSGIDTRATPSIFASPCIIDGNVYSSFNPMAAPYPLSHQPEYVTTYEIYNCGGDRDYVMLKNYKPGTWIDYPASITVGGDMYRYRLYGTGSFEQIGQCSSNLLDGRGVFQYPRPQAPYERHIYPNNNEKKVRTSIFKTTIESPFGNLQFVPDSDIDSNHLINDTNYPGKITEESILLDETKGADIENMEFTLYKASGPAPVPDKAVGYDSLESLQLRSEFRNRVNALEEAYGPENKRAVYMLKKGFEILQTMGAAWDWNDSARFAIKSSLGVSLPLVDKGIVASFSYNEPAAPVVTTGVIEETGEPWSLMTWDYKLENNREMYQIDPDDNDLLFNNAIILAKENLELSGTDLRGDNSLLQVEGDLMMNSGNLVCGDDIGMVIYCENFYTAGGGKFNGIIMVQKCVKLGGGMDGAQMLEAKGAIILKGDPQEYESEVIEEEGPYGPPGPWPGPPPLNTRVSYIFDNNGLVAQGIKLEYDPGFMRVLNRYGRLRVTCWKELD